MPTLRIALAQINPVVGDFAANAALIAGFLRQAWQGGAHLAVFPELCLCGYPPEDLLLKPRFLADTRQALAQVAQATQGITAVVGYAEEDQGQVYNSAALLHDGAWLASYRKTELPNYGVFDEKRYFTPGQGGLLLDLGGVRILLSICEDLWVPGSDSQRAALANQAQVTINISASPFHAGKLELRRQIVSDFARRTGTLVCYANLLGGQDELVFDGGSLIIDPQGGLLACARRFEQDLMLCDLDLPEAGGLPQPKAPDRLLCLPAPPAPAGPSAPPACAPEMGLEEEVYRALVLGTGDYVRKNGFKKVVLGLSGGIDSSLVAAVAAQALGRDNVVGVTMPSQFTSKETRSDAEVMAANLGIRLITVPIKAILAVYLAELEEAFGPGPRGVEVENLQARIRGNTLMALSNRFGWLVLTTGNKSETAVGYCTLYGDMAGGFAVIKDVPKTLVYQLAAHVNAQAGHELIPQSVIDRPPSAELRPDQKDEDSLPPYAVLDPILTAYVEQDKALDEIAALGFEPGVVREIVRLVDLNEYKRRQAPPGVKITPKAFGRDRRLPITNHYRPGWD
ncbi:MAG: NAD+ synthase [Desulfarculus sp.]|nr:NAD+ synthase [Desulfarculus sp.]